ncbi:hypothetical protein [Leptolyngbya iicbica]|uniref:PEP-CTERM sorting domain-containing protein n=2 Tax=Cyanophyceae TaxID=3028117 RepID=A0A4Q7EI57_9CYAN|nr:hypothetical protein [Leptolyngbya sp. LK]RZM82728.1 PEP-CTERM sorting domain-containing protein [Leptolyngbya sp. LK]
MKTSIALQALALTLSTVGTLAVTTLPSQAADLGGLQVTGLDCSSALVTAGGANFATCQGAFTGNDTGAQSAFLTALNDGLFADFTEASDWSLWGKSDEGDFTADQGEVAGTWSLLNMDSLTGPFVLSLKSSNAFSAYLFTDATTVTDGTFSTLGVSTNAKGKPQALSHASIFVPASVSQEVVELDEPSLSITGVLMLLAGAPLAMAMTKTKSV